MLAHGFETFLHHVSPPQTAALNGGQQCGGEIASQDDMLHRVAGRRAIGKVFFELVDRFPRPKCERPMARTAFAHGGGSRVIVNAKRRAQGAPTKRPTSYHLVRKIGWHIKRAQARMWGDWMTIGEGLMEGRNWAMQVAGANRPEGKGYVTAYAEWLKRYKVDDMDKSDRAKLLQLMEERPAVEEWRATLTDHERRNLNNPVVVWRKWTAATRVKKFKPRSAGVSGTEHSRARAMVEQLQERGMELDQEREEARQQAEALRVLLSRVLDEVGDLPEELRSAIEAALR
jgi:hypothetical protein